ncbi:MAG: alpha-amylase [Deltaproteobacteria bacterium]|nr:alpha-amylase [Deltaproteobacteria bacterium]
METPIIYNIFPRLAGNCQEWKDWASKARDMGFNWIYLNPFSKVGLSGSLYAVKDYFSVDDSFRTETVGSSTCFPELQDVLQEIHQMGLNVMFDLVINHTSIDSVLVEKHPEWYKKDEKGKFLHPSAIDPADARKVTTWGDLYEIDNEESPDLEGLYNYWEGLVDTYVNIGAGGFRCDAAYKVPGVLWKRLMERAEKVAGRKIPFFAETLGCTIEEVSALKDAGFSYLYNSGKYWNFDAPWAIEQHRMFGEIAPSVGFPESHDTSRLAKDVNDNLDVIKQRYLFGISWSEAFQITMGFEYGYHVKPDVVKMTRNDQESPRYDLTSFICNANRFKLSIPVLCEEGSFDNVTRFEAPTLVLEKKSNMGNDSIYIIINKDWENSQWTELPMEMELCRLHNADQVVFEASPRWIELSPAEVVFGRKI